MKGGHDPDAVKGRALPGLWATDIRPDLSPMLRCRTVPCPPWTRQLDSGKFGPRVYTNVSRSNSRLYTHSRRDFMPSRLPPRAARGDPPRLLPMRLRGFPPA